MNANKRNLYLTPVSLPHANLENHFDVVDLCNVTKDKAFILYFLDHFKGNKVHFFSNEFVMKMNQTSGSNNTHLLVRRIKKTDLFQIDAYYDVPYPLKKELPIVTIVFENNFSKEKEHNVEIIKTTYFDYISPFYTIPFFDQKLTPEQIRDKEIIFNSIAALVVAVSYSIYNATNVTGRYGTLPKSGNLLDNQLNIVSEWKKFRIATIK